MSVLALTTSLYMLQVYDRVLSSRSVETLLLLTLIATAAIGVFGALDSLRSRLLSRIALRVADALSARILRAMIATSSQNGGLSLRSGLREVDTLRAFISSPGLTAMIDAPFVVVYLVVLYLLNPYFVLIVVLGGIVLAAIAVTNQRLTNPQLTHSIQLLARAHEFAEDGIENADVLEGMGMSASYVERWRRNWLESLKAGSSASDRDTRLSSTSRGVRLLIQIFLLGAGALLILDFHATGGIMIGATIIGARALAPIETIVSTWKNFIATRVAWTRLSSLLDQAPRRDEGMPLPAPHGGIRLSSVHFVVPSTRRTVLANIGFELAQGELLGIIGPSASGKSTLLRLMTGAWPCTAGTVRLDGADIYTWPRSELGRFIGYLPQDVELFTGTVRENIARMSEGDPDKVVRAAQLAGANEMILSLPKGYDTDIGDRGHRLSGGQSQRIGIARALYGEPRYVVLDEPNSNLDGAGEEALRTTLATLKRVGTTVVIVAHRPSILQIADKVLVLRSNGTIEAFGPRAEVLQQFSGPRTSAIPSSAGRL